MTETNPRRIRHATEHGLYRNEILKAFDSLRPAGLSLIVLVNELDIDRVDLSVQLEKMKEDGLVERISKSSDSSDGADEFVWWPVVAPRLSLETVKQIVQVERSIEAGETDPLTDSNGQQMANVRTTSRVRESIRSCEVEIQDHFRRRIREMDTDPESNLIRVLEGSEYILEVGDYRAVVRWDQLSYRFFIVAFAHRSTIYQ